jgi:hypothetical protein
MYYTAEFQAQCPISSKVRGLAKNGGLPGWLGESDPSGVILYMMNGPYQLFRTVPVALTGAAS